MVDHATKEEATPSSPHGGKYGDKKSQGDMAFKKKILRVDTWTRKVRVYWKY